jgi:hypothetical protein
MNISIGWRAKALGHMMAIMKQSSGGPCHSGPLLFLGRGDESGETVRQSMEELKKQRFRGYPSCGKQGQQPPTVVEWFSFLLGSEGQCGCDSRSNRRALRILYTLCTPAFYCDIYFHERNFPGIS